MRMPTVRLSVFTIELGSPTQFDAMNTQHLPIRQSAMDHTLA